MVRVSFEELLKSEAMYHQAKARRITRKNLVKCACKYYIVYYCKCA